MRIAYLGSDAFEELAADIVFSTKKEIQQVILEHPDTKFFSLTDFALAFNNEEISDLGYMAICKDDKKTLIY